MTELKYDSNGLIPAIVQDHYTKQVLMLAYMNAESLKISMEEGTTPAQHGFSRAHDRSCGTRVRLRAISSILFQSARTATVIRFWLT